MNRKISSDDHWLPGVHRKKQAISVGISTVVVSFFIHIGGVVIGQDTLHLNKYAGNLKTIDVSINGSPYSFLFDTGGGETLLSPGIATKNNRVIYGSMTGFRMHGEPISYQQADSLELSINSTSLYHATVGVWDVMSVLPANLPPLDGVLSLKSFVGKRITLDLLNNRIIVETKKSYRKRIAHMTRHPSRFANGLHGNEVMIFLEARNGGRSFWFLMDSGNLGYALLSPTTAAAWKLTADSLDGSLGNVSFRLGSETLPIESREDRIIYDGALNYKMLSSFTILIDLVDEEVWIGSSN